MADYAYRGNLSAKVIPVNPDLFGRSIVVKDRDQNYAPNVTSRTDVDKDIGMPQVMYIANYLPTEYGYSAIGLYGSKETCPGTPYTAFPVRNSTSVITLVHTTEGYLYRLKKSTEGSEVPQFVYIGQYVGNISYALAAGSTYIYVAGVGCYQYNFNDDTLSSVTLSGLAPEAILGITSTGGYMLAWSSDAIAWSSLVNPTDFVPSLDTGAGGGGVEGAKGAITVCVSNSYGVYIFTESNCVSAQLSNNARFPFNFKEIVGSSGVESAQQVSFEGNQNSAYAFTSAGFQQISHNGAKNLWTELHENGLNCPIWNENTVISSGATSGVDGKIVDAKLVNVGSKYICVSIKARTNNYYDQCWIYDTALDKWGRIVKDHYDVFETDDFKIGFITTTNRYIHVDSPFSTSPYPIEPDLPYIALGRYQYSRARLTMLQQIDLENCYPVDIRDVNGDLLEFQAYPKVYDMASLDGKSGVFEEMYRDAFSSVAYARYLTRKTALNHTILVKGFANLNSIVLLFTQGGNR